MALLLKTLLNKQIFMVFNKQAAAFQPERMKLKGWLVCK
jgi:hypothetical protein